MAADPPSVASKAVVTGYFDDVANGRFEAARARLAPDATLWVVGEGRWPLGGEHGPDGQRRLYALVKNRFPDGLRMTVTYAMAEGERVVVEAQSSGVRRDGRAYANTYVYVVTVRDGLIRHRREYCDILHAQDLLCGPMAAEAAHG